MPAMRLLTKEEYLAELRKYGFEIHLNGNGYDIWRHKDAETFITVSQFEDDEKIEDYFLEQQLRAAGKLYNSVVSLFQQKEDA